MVAKNGYFGSILGAASATNNPVVPEKPVVQDKTEPSGIGTHVSYTTDANGNRVQITYDSTGKIISSRKVGTVVGSEYNAGANTGSTGYNAGGSQMNASNWQKLIAFLKDRFGFSI